MKLLTRILSVAFASSLLLCATACDAKPSGGNENPPTGTEMPTPSYDGKFAISYELDGGTNAQNNPSEYTYLEKTELSAPTKSGYDFMGWKMNGIAGATVTEIPVGMTGEVKLYALWQQQSTPQPEPAEEYAVEYELNGGTNAQNNPIKYTYLERVTLLEATQGTREFIGWALNSVSGPIVTEIPVGMTGRVVLYALWKEETQTEQPKYDVAYVLNDSVNAQGNPVQYTYMAATPLSAPTKSGFEFLGWGLNSANGPLVTEIPVGMTGNVTLYATWQIEGAPGEPNTPSTYTISYELDGGTKAQGSPVAYTYLTAVPLLTATKAGFAFTGWKLNSASGPLVTSIPVGMTGNVTLYATWEASPSHTVSYVLNGGTNASENPTSYTEGVAVGLAAPTMDGNTFIGWRLNGIDGELVSEISASATEDVTLYATWKRTINVGDQTYANPLLDYPTTHWTEPVNFSYEDSLNVGSGDTTGVRGLFFDSVEYNGKKTKVAAYIGFPDGIDSASEANKVPAIVLVHGAGGTAIPEWVRYWNEQGFAAISMDLEGAEPTAGVNNTDNYHIARNRYDNGALDSNYTAGPGNSAVGDGKNGVENQWLYHATSAVIKATTLLTSFPCVDIQKVGVTGISWGSVVTSVAIGYDDRFSFAMPIYGGVSVSQSCSSFEYMFEEPYREGNVITGEWKSEADRLASEEMKARWDTLEGLKQTDCKVFYVTSTNDFAFSADIASRCAEAAKGFCNFKPGFLHGQQEGATEASLPEYAKHAIGDTTADFVEITKHPTKTDATIAFETYGNAKVSGIKVFYSNAERPGENKAAAAAPNHWESKAAAKVIEGKKSYSLSIPACKWAFIQVEYNDGSRSVTSYMFEGPESDVQEVLPETTGTLRISDNFTPISNTEYGLAIGEGINQTEVYEYSHVANINQYGLLNYAQCLLPASKMDAYMDAADGWITYKISASQGNLLKNLVLDLNCMYGHGGGLYWYNASLQDGQDKLGANLYVEVSYDNEQFTKVYDMNESNPSFIKENEKGTITPKVDLSLYAQGEETVYVRIYMMQMTAAQVNHSAEVITQDGKLSYNRFGIGIKLVSFQADMMAK